MLWHGEVVKAISKDTHRPQGNFGSTQKIMAEFIVIQQHNVHGGHAQFVRLDTEKSYGLIEFGTACLVYCLRGQPFLLLRCSILGDNVQFAERIGRGSAIHGWQVTRARHGAVKRMISLGVQQRHLEPTQRRFATHQTLASSGDSAAVARRRFRH